MLYRFEPNSSKGICRVKDIQIAWYDMENNGNCFDEAFKNVEVPTEHILAYVETEEDRDKINHSRVFINMDDGDTYELIMMKCESDCTNFNDDQEFCEWIKYDYRTICPKYHDIGNPYWRIPVDDNKLRYCPYCGKKIKMIG